MLASVPVCVGIGNSGVSQMGMMLLPGAFGNAGELSFYHNIFIFQGFYNTVPQTR